MITLRNYIVLLFIILLPAYSNGQPPCFDADDTVGCAPFLVTLTNCADPTKPIAYDYGDGSTLSFDTTHTYSTPGYYTIIQYVGSGASIDTLIKQDHIRVVGTPEPIFDINACQGINAQIAILDTNYDRFIIDYGDGSPNDTVLQGTNTNKLYTDTILKTITITGYYLGAPCTNSDSKQLTLYNSLLVAEINSIINISNNVAGTLEYSISGFSHLNYYYEQQLFPSVYSIIDSFNLQNTDTTIIINPLNTANNIYCYQTTVYDQCGNSSVSQELCHISIQGNAINNQNELQWSTYTGTSFDHYELYRDNLLIATIPLDTFYIDTNVNCGVNYCYDVRAILSTQNSDGVDHMSVSNTQCLTAISTDTPDEVVETNSTISGSDIQLFWNKPASSVNTYEISRSLNGSGFLVIANHSTNDTIYIDSDVDNSSNEYCYKISYTDSCGNYSNQTNVLTTCPILLSIIESPTDNVLNWTSYTGFSTGVQEYLVDWLDADNNVIATISVGISLTYTDTSVDTSTTTIKYRIRASPNLPLSFNSISNTVISNKSLKLFFPNAFTPNNDGNNDEFKPVGSFIQNYKLIIMTRWGEVYYYTENFNEGWNGRSPQGEELPNGVYIYQAEVSDNNGVQSSHRGTFHLLH